MFLSLHKKNIIKQEKKVKLCQNPHKNKFQI